MPRWEPNARMRLVESALELFEQQGYDDTAVVEIAARAGLTKTTFFRHFPDKREVLFAGQEAHQQLLAEAVAAAPAAATPLEADGLALAALAGTLPSERHAFAARLQEVIDGHSELRERAALKRAGYVDALTDALARRSVPDPARTLAADLGVLAFLRAFARWVEAPAGPSLAELVREDPEELLEAGASLR